MKQSQVQIIQKFFLLLLICSQTPSIKAHEKTNSVQKFPLSLGHFPTDMLRIIFLKAIESQNIPESRKSVRALKTSCKRFNDFLKKETVRPLEEFFCALQSKNFEKVKKIFNYLARTTSMEHIFFKQDKDGNTVMHYLAKSGNRELISSFQTIYSKYKNTRSEELIEAIRKNNIEKIKQLILTKHPDSGIRLNMISNNKGLRPHQVASGIPSFYFTFLHSHEFLNLRGKCCFEESTEIQPYCKLCRKTNFFQPAVKRFTPLMMACVLNNHEAIQLLLTAGANPNVQSDGNKTNFYDFPPLCTPLMLTTDLKIKKLLLQHGAQPNLKNFSNETALFYALKVRDINSVKLLLKAGATINSKDSEYRSPLGYYWEIIDGNPVGKDWEILQLIANQVKRKSPFEKAILQKDRFIVEEILTNTKILVKELIRHEDILENIFTRKKRFSTLRNINAYFSKNRLAPNVAILKKSLVLYLLKYHNFFDDDTLVKYFRHLMHLGANIHLNTDNTCLLSRIVQIESTRGIELLRDC